MGYFDQIVAHIGQRAAMNCFSAGDGTEIQLTAAEDGFLLSHEPFGCLELGLPYLHDGKWEINLRDYWYSSTIDRHGAQTLADQMCCEGRSPSNQLTDAVLAALTKAFELHAQDRMLLREFKAEGFSSYAVLDLTSKLHRVVVHEPVGRIVEVTFCHDNQKTKCFYDHCSQESTSEQLLTQLGQIKWDGGLSQEKSRKLIDELTSIIWERF